MNSLSTRWCRSGVCMIGALILTASFTPQATAQAGAGKANFGTHISKIALRPCGKAGSEEGAQCGKYEVYEDREAKSGRKIELNILVLPALSATPKPDPVFYLEGGPGGSARLSRRLSSHCFRSGGRIATWYL